MTPGLELCFGRAVTAAVLAVESAPSAFGTCRSWSNIADFQNVGEIEQNLQQELDATS